MGGKNAKARPNQVPNQYQNPVPGNIKTGAPFLS
jgi:hypothetical protein